MDEKAVMDEKDLEAINELPDNGAPFPSEEVAYAEHLMVTTGLWELSERVEDEDEWHRIVRSWRDREMPMAPFPHVVDCLASQLLNIERPNKARPVEAHVWRTEGF